MGGTSFSNFRTAGLFLVVVDNDNVDSFNAWFTFILQSVSVGIIPNLYVSIQWQTDSKVDASRSTLALKRGHVKRIRPQVLFVKIGIRLVSSIPVSSLVFTCDNGTSWHAKHLDTETLFLGDIADRDITVFIRSQFLVGVAVFSKRRVDFLLGDLFLCLVVNDNELDVLDTTFIFVLYTC